MTEKAIRQAGIRQWKFRMIESCSENGLVRTPIQGTIKPGRVLPKLTVIPQRVRGTLVQNGKLKLTKIPKSVLDLADRYN
jgi:hypothetical protein